VELARLSNARLLIANRLVAPTSQPRKSSAMKHEAEYYDIMKMMKSKSAVVGVVALALALACIIGGAVVHSPLYCHRLALSF
jgi:2-methylaconitate cis-trans-isomerase PrpF